MSVKFKSKEYGKLSDSVHGIPDITLWLISNDGSYPHLYIETDGKNDPLGSGISYPILEDAIHPTADDLPLDSETLEKLKTWIRCNRDLLLSLWYERIDMPEFCEALKTNERIGKQEKQQSIRVEKLRNLHDNYKYQLIVANKGYSKTVPFCSTYSYLTMDQIYELHRQISELIDMDEEFGYEE